MDRPRQLIFILAFSLLSLVLCFSAAQAEDFILGSEDVIQVSIWGNPELGVTVPVRPDGKISLPLGGDIQAAGKTPSELREAIAEELKSYIKTPSVSVVVMEVNSPRIYLIGNSGEAGVITLRSEMTILQLLARLGTIGELDLERVYIIRNHKRLDFDLRELVEKGLAEKNILLQAGDIISIPDAFANRITVLGEVTTPGNIPFRADLTLVDALVESGWVTEFANLKRVFVVRGSGSEQKTFEVNVALIQKGEKLETNMKLTPGDLVIVKARLF